MYNRRRFHLCCGLRSQEVNLKKSCLAFKHLLIISCLLFYEDRSSLVEGFLNPSFEMLCIFFVVRKNLTLFLFEAVIFCHLSISLLVRGDKSHPCKSKLSFKSQSSSPNQLPELLRRKKKNKIMQIKSLLSSKSFILLRRYIIGVIREYVFVDLCGVCMCDTF